MKTVTTSIDIAADPARIWAILTDFAAYPGWNPFITSASGVPEVGQRLTIRVAPPGGKPMTFRPRVLAAEPGRRLRWKGRLLIPGLFDGEHDFRIEPRDGGVRLHHGERFSGLFVALTGDESFRRIEAGFEAMNRALKSRAEAGAI